MAPPARAALHPVLSSPKRLAFAGLGVTLIVYAIQLASGIPPWIAWSPVEISSNVVAAMGLAWTAIQLRASWADRDVAGAWLAASAGMALLSIEDHVGELFTLETHGQDEMSLSIAIWLVAAWMIFRVGRRYAMRRSVQGVLRLGFLIQIAAQLIGWWAAYGSFSNDAVEFLDYVNDTGELLAVLAYLIALLLAVFSANKSYDFPLAAIGRKGREIYDDFALSEASRRPAMHWAGIREAVTALAILRQWRRAAEAVQANGGPSPARQLFDLARCGFFSRVDPRSYYLLELYRPDGLARSIHAAMTPGETRNGLTASIQETRRARPSRDELEDRVSFARVCEAFGLPVAPVLGIAEAGTLHPTSDLADLDRDLFVRSRSAAGGSFSMTLTREEPLIYRDEEDNILNVDMAMSRVAAMSRLQSLIVAPKLRNHESIARYARSSLLVFRVVTCLDADDEPRVTHGLLRMRNASEPDWPRHDGAEWGSAINLDTGVFGPVASDAPEACTDWRYAHPVTREMIAGRTCEGWPAISKLAADAHRAFGGHVVVGWDIGWTPDGPVLLAGEANLDFSFIQRCYGVPIGLSPLAPLLDMHLDRVVALRV